MKIDANPEIIFLSYGKEKEQKAFIDAVRKRGRSIREIRLFAVEQPLDKNFDSDINFYKHFILNEYWFDRNPLLHKHSMMIEKIKETIFNQSPFKPIKFERGQWQNDNRHELLFALICPLLYQDTNTEKWLETSEEKKNYEKLKKFQSEGYQPKITGVYDV